MGRFDKLEPETPLPDDVRSALERLNLFDHLEIGALGGSSGKATDGKILCPGCSQLNEREREACWACYRLLGVKAAPAKEREITLVLDGRTYGSLDLDLPADVRELMDRISKDGYSAELMEEWRGWRAAQGPVMATKGPDRGEIKEGGKEIKVFKGERVSVIKMDGKVYSSDSPSLPPELKRVFDYIDKNGVTPALMEELRRLGKKVDFRPQTTADPSAGDLEFWKEVNGFKAGPDAVPEESAARLKPHLEAMEYFLRKGAAIATVAETMAALTDVPGRDAERYLSGQIMAGGITLSGSTGAWPWNRYAVLLPVDSAADFPKLCPCCEEKRATKKVTHGFRQYTPGRKRVQGFWLIELLDYAMNSKTFTFEYPVCDDCAGMFQLVGLSQLFWPVIAVAAAAAWAGIALGAAALVLAAAVLFRGVWARFGVDQVGTTMVSYSMSSRYYAQLFTLANAAEDRVPAQGEGRRDWGRILRFAFQAALLAAAAYAAYFIFRQYSVAFRML